MTIVNTCTVSKWGCHSVQYMVLLLKSDMLADSIYKHAVHDGMTSSAVIMSCCKRKAWTVSDMVQISDTGHEHPGIVADGHYSSATLAPWQTIGQTRVNVWQGKPLETRSPLTKRLTSQHCCMLRKKWWW